VKALKAITIVGTILGAGALGALGADTSISVSDQIRAAITLFQVQKAEFLSQQRELGRSNAGRARDEVRDEVAAAKVATIKPLVQELRQSIEDAKSHAREQSRKLTEEAAEAARTRH
jgi:hypothetical protein